MVVPLLPQGALPGPPFTILPLAIILNSWEKELVIILSLFSGLNEGETYYARSFAFRSMDTTYGNCIEFVAEETLGFDENKQNNLVQLYPIPSTGIVYLVLGKDLCLNTNLSITDLGGHQVYYANLGSVAYKGNIFTLDLAHLEDGILCV
jgi:hypothetical protein